MEFAARRFSIILICVLFFLFSSVFSISESKNTRLSETDLNRINKPFVKSIRSPDGDIIDCVLFHLQPAFDGQELKATMPLDPPIEASHRHSKVGTELELKQKWSSKGEACPDGTIPIRRTREYEIFRPIPISHFGKNISASIKTNSIFNGHEHAVGYAYGEFYGAKAILNVWAPNVSNPTEFSLSHVLIGSNIPTNALNAIEAGWQVSTKLGKDKSPRIYIYWTNDGYRSGCYNLLCSGFVQTSSKIALGAAIYPISAYDGPQFDITLSISKEPKSGNWWLKVGSSLVGYWPRTLFPNLQEKATLVEFGGEVYNGPLGPHTSAEMGSGHFPDEGFGKTTYIRNLEVIDTKHKANPLSSFSLFAEKRNCYNVTSGFADNWVFSIQQDNQVIPRVSESKTMKLIKTHLKKINKPFVKSIKSPDGDTIDCVLFHFQPAFDLPELKSTVPVNPPSEPSNGKSRTKIESKLKQIWSSKGDFCPDGTIPIRRTRKDDVLRSVPISKSRMKFNTPSNTDSIREGHEHAIGYVRGEYYGANATLNVWAPNVTNQKEFSLSQIWVVNDVRIETVNTIEVGWRVSPSVYEDNFPRLFIYWTSDGYRNGCYNLLCSGFVQTNSEIALGAAIDPISTYNNQQYDINLLVWKDPNSMNWWLKVGSSLVGYWPATLFPYLRDHATIIEFGGEVYNSQTSGSHTSTQMGSGHFPYEGFGKASYIRNIEVVDEKNKLNRVSDVNLYTNKPNCYDVTNNQLNSESKKMKLIKTHLKKINKPFVKSIKSPDGDIIDCVPFHIQPAFDLPELKSTALLNPPQEPSNRHSMTRMESKLKQKWSSKGESCPRGTIPIRRTSKYDILRSDSISRFGKKSNTRIMKNSVNLGHEYALGYVKGEYYGVNATLNVWAPNVTTKLGFSLSQIWLVTDVSRNSSMNTIEAGWQVSPSTCGDSSPRLFIYWTSDGYINGCYNLLCSGFVQTNDKIALGAAIDPISTYNDQQYDINLLIWKDPNSKNWWLRVGSSLVGYWPSTLFTDLREHATLVEFGGEVYNSEISDSHTSTQMGSGHFAEEGFGKASYIRNIEVVDGENKLNRVSDMTLYADKTNCYDVTSGSAHDWGSYIYFGGPGNNPNCPTN
ncbi:hypothetical protein OSB04_018601 [Centaurea solstitialis]|uniref:Neprosin PEP catalytic domain-containing protein n=1 Tax=Centaurea solstitialis TaxID=347529 RepID=A0AA38WN52_9ASTR|nr:hypothetical protein OSB04_018601 [Centaurea solstitialis]